MIFPVYLDFFGLRLHPHLVFEALGHLHLRRDPPAGRTLIAYLTFK